MSRLRIGLGVLAALALFLAILGIGQGGAPSTEAAPTGAALEASKQAIAMGGPAVQDGKEEFSDEHCSTCHAIAATGADGLLGPRMDTQHDSAHEIQENIALPRKDIAEGYEAKLMPTDYSDRMSGRQIADVAAFIKAASTGTDNGGPGPGGDGDGDGD